MLKGKSKAFKPKGPVRRTGGTATASSSTAPSKATTRETTQEPTSSAIPTANTANTAKRKDREDDSTVQPPAKRVATPPPSETNSTTTRDISPTVVRQISQSPQPTSPTSIRHRSQPPLPTPPPTQPAADTPEPSHSQVDALTPQSHITESSKPTQTTESAASASESALSSVPIAESSERPLQPDSAPSDAAQISSLRKPRKAPARNAATTNRSGKVAPSTTSVSTPTNVPSIVTQPSVTTSLPDPRSIGASSTTNATISFTQATSSPSEHTGKDDQASVGNLGLDGTSLGPAGRDLGPAGTSSQIQSVAAQAGPALGGAGDVGGIEAGGVQGGSQRVPMAALNPDVPSGGLIEAPTTKPKKKRVVRTKRRSATQTGEDGTSIDVDAPPKRGRPKKVRQSKSRKERSSTPSDAEEEMVDTSTLTMTELCKDLRIGKKFSRHDDIKQREEVKKAAQQARKGVETDVLLDGLFPADGAVQATVRNEPQAVDNIQPAAPVVAPPPEREASPEPIRQGGQAVMMRIVDGQIVIDERSIQVDRHRLAEQDVLPQDIVEENDFTRVITSGTYMKREKNQRWDWSSIEKFYNGLKSFGTDFGLIANMFPGRTRKQIKLLFNREERCNPELIKRTLAGQPIPVNFEEYSAMSGKTFVEISEIVAESKALDDQHKAELAEIETRKNAANKKKKDAIHGRNAARDILDAVSDDEDDYHRPSDAGAGEKENRAPSSVGGPGSRSREASTGAGLAGKRGKKGGKANKANKHSMRAGGDIVEVVGNVE